MNEGRPSPPAERLPVTAEDCETYPEILRKDDPPLRQLAREKSDGRRNGGQTSDLAEDLNGLSTLPRRVSRKFEMQQMTRFCRGPTVVDPTWCSVDSGQRTDRELGRMESEP